MEEMNQYAELVNKDGKLAVDYIVKNKKIFDSIYDGASNDFILNAKVRHLNSFLEDYDEIKYDVLSLNNKYSSQSAMIYNFLKNAQEKLTQLEIKKLEAMLCNHATRYSIIYFTSIKADFLNNFSVDDDFLDFIKQLTIKVKNNINSEELEQLTQYVNQSRKNNTRLSSLALSKVKEIL